MLKCQSRVAARILAPTRNAHYGWSAHEEGWFVGTPDELRAAGVRNPTKPGIPEDPAREEIEQSIRCEVSSVRLHYPDLDDEHAVIVALLGAYMHRPTHRLDIEAAWEAIAPADGTADADKIRHEILSEVLGESYLTDLHSRLHPEPEFLPEHGDD